MYGKISKHSFTLSSSLLLFHYAVGITVWKIGSFWLDLGVAMIWTFYPILQCGSIRYNGVLTFLENYDSVYFDQRIMTCYSQVAVLICPGIEINFQMLLGLKKL